MEEAAVMETKPCDNCKKDVPVGNYLNHSIHCPRNIRLCPRCNEPYPIIEMESHIDNDHAEVVCPECYEFMEAADLPLHKTDSCPKRLVSCIICEVDLPASELSEHLDYCGSRSDRCDGCGKLVLLKHQPFHLSTRHKLVKPETESQQAQCMEQFLNQYKKVTNSGRTEQNNNHNRSNSNKQIGTNSNKSTASSSFISKGTQSNSYTSNNGINTASTASSSNNSSSSVNIISSSSSSASASSTSLVSPLKSSSSPSSTTLPSSSYLSSLPTPSPSVVALLEPVFNEPSSSRGSTSTAPSTLTNNPIRPLSHISAPSTAPSVPSNNNSTISSNSWSDPPSVATLRNVENAIRECVDSISAGLRVGSNGSTAASISSSLNNLRTHSAGNITGSSSRNSPNIVSTRSNRDGTGLSINRILSNINNSNTASSTALSQSSSNQRASSNTFTSTPSNAANEPHYEEEGAASLESQFNSLPQAGPKFEVLRPNGSEPSDRMKPVNRPPLQTRRRNYQDDVLTEYMHLLEEQGLSNGLASRTNHSKPTPNTNPYNGRLVQEDNNDDLFNNHYNGGIVGARGLRDNNTRQHIAPPMRETVRERAERIRREREREELTALTRATELRGLNQVLSQERQVVNQVLDEEAALCLPCEFCDAPIPMDHLILHQTGCRPDLIYH